MTSHRLLGLRVDVDTHDGMRDGVPRLLDVLHEASTKATFFLSMGPDRSGLAVLNLFRRGFIQKMSRTRAIRLYGWRTLMSGTILPARHVALAHPEVAREVRDRGHESGVHAWDHRAWQDRLAHFSPERIRAELDKAHGAYEAVLGEAPTTFAAPAWLSADAALLHEETYGLEFASDCRGLHPFRPIVAGRILNTPQVPSTLPTLDETLGQTCRNAADYFDRLIEQIERESWPVLTVHAELEGGPFAGEFAGFLRKARRASIRCVPLGELLEARRRIGALPVSPLKSATLPGRHGVVSMQSASA